MLSVHDLATGAEQWNSGGCDVHPSAPVVTGGRLFYASRACVGAHETSLRSVVLADRSGLWGASTCCEPNFAPAVANSTVYFLEQLPPSSRRLVALDAETGAERWGTPMTSTCLPTAPTVSGGRVYAQGTTFDASTGSKLWDWPTCAASSVVTVTPKSLFVPYRSSTGASRLQAVDPATGAVQWAIPWNENVHKLPSIPAAANGLLFAAGGNKLIARDASNGAVLWRSPEITGTFSDPIVSDGMVFAMASDGAVHAYALP
jgi:outer membrane protein assembly factor BamB